MDPFQEGIPLPSETARRMLSMGINVVPMERGAKDPHRKQWIREEHRIEDVEQDFPLDTNLGVLLGGVSGNLVDVDLDTIEAVRIGEKRLPKTGLIWGRKSKPRSHYLYRLPPGESLPKNIGWNDPTPPDNGNGKKNARLLELRWNGQTVAPGSINTASGKAEGVRYEPDGNGTPRVVPATALMSVGPWIAAGALVARWWAEGTRHDMALPLAGFLWHGGMPEDKALRFMEDVCIGAGDDQIDNRLDCVRDTYRNGANGNPITGATALEEYLTEAQIRKLHTWLGIQTKRVTGILGPDNLPLAGDGDGDRFAERFGGRVLYCALEDQWYIWNNIYWERDDVKHIKEMAKEVVREFRQKVFEGEKICGMNGIAPFKDCMNYAAAMGNETALNNMLKEAQSKPEIRIKPEDFDVDRRFFNVLNGTLEFDPDTGEVGWHDHDPNDKITLLSPVFYSTDAADTHRPIVDEWLDRFFPEPDRREFLFRLAGDTLHGFPKRHGVNLVGETNSGKSLTLKLFSAVLGDYAAGLEYTSFSMKWGAGGDTPRSDLWRVRRKRLVTVSEVPPDVKLDVTLVKSILSGGDNYRIRTLYDRTGGRDIQWSMSLWMSGNKPYGPPPSEEAAYERLHILQCDHQVPREERSDTKQRQLLDVDHTGSAVLALMVEGFKLLYGRDKGRLVEPASSKEAKTRVLRQLAATDQWQELVDTLVLITNDPKDGVLRSELAAKAIELSQDASLTRVKPRVFQRELEEALVSILGSSYTHTSTRWANKDYWKGVRWGTYALDRWPNTITLPDWE